MAKKQQKRDTYKYKLKEGNEILNFGITDDLKRRESEHKSEGKQFSKMEKVGPAVTRESALKWERESIKKYKKSHGGKSPSDFEDKVYQTLVKDNLLWKEKSTILPLSSVILNLKNFVQEVKQEIKNFRKAEDDRLENISIE